MDNSILNNDSTYPTFESDVYQFNLQEDFDLVYEQLPEISGFIDIEFSDMIVKFEVRTEIPEWLQKITTKRNEN